MFQQQQQQQQFQYPIILTSMVLPPSPPPTYPNINETVIIAKVFSLERENEFLKREVYTLKRDLKALIQQSKNRDQENATKIDLLANRLNHLIENVEQLTRPNNLNDLLESDSNVSSVSSDEPTKDESVADF